MEKLTLKVIKKIGVPEIGGLYYCKHCKKTFYRKSTKNWIQSYCDTTDRNVHLQRIKTVKAIGECREMGE